MLQPSSSRMLHVFVILCLSPAVLNALQCGGLQNNERVDCYPDSGSNELGCLSRGCCWQNTSSHGAINVPYCFFPSDFPSYSIVSVSQNSSGALVANLRRSQPSGRPDDVKDVKLTVEYQTDSRLRLRFEDRDNKRWEPPIPLGQSSPVSAMKNDFNVNLLAQPFGVTVERKSDGRKLFDTASMSAPLIFADQFLQISSRLQTTKVYGVGEQRLNFTHDLSSSWMRLALWARDQHLYPNKNLYGVHNFMLALFDDGTASGIFFLNSNAQEVLFQPLPAVTYRTIGGILDFYIFSGPTPIDVVRQYYDLIGKPMMPPYWSLGFHLSRWGFKTVADANRTLSRNLAAGMPLDVMWNDIDYMDKYRDWTLDPVNYKDLPSFVDYVHAIGMRYVMIVDPGISNSNPGQYPPYDQGIQKRVFIMNATGSAPIVGNVWPGSCVFPDFTAPQTTEWWYSLANTFHKTVPYNGIWIDMNEPSNFVAGSDKGCPSENKFDFPPYTPWVVDHSLFAKTICPSSLQNISNHYNLHSMYGYFEAKATNYALQKFSPEKRVFILSRSTFVGSGRYTFHWTGDNQATWDNVQYSINQILNFNLFGIPMVGADICGFQGNTTEELCIRWMQLGAFYPFMRSHNTIDSFDQDPARWSPSAQQAMRSALQLRYSLLPYFYTQFFLASTIGRPIARPLFMEFSKDPITYGIDSQFMVGPGLLVSPVLSPGATSVYAYLPNTRWCDVQTGVALTTRGKYGSLDAPLNRINVHIGGGHIIPTKPSAANTAAQQNLPYSLRACLDDNGMAFGDLFSDDGETMLEYKRYNYLHVSIDCGSLQTTPLMNKGGDIYLKSLWVSGVIGPAPTNVTVNDVQVKFSFDVKNQILHVDSLNQNLLKPLKITWK